jgi:hypothetical protein
MPQPPQDVDTLLEDVLQDLPPETVALAREFKAFTRARTIHTPVPLRRRVLLDGGLDKALRDVAGTSTLLVEAITDSAVAERLAACRPWGRARLAQLGRCPTTLPAPWRFLVRDGRGIQAPGARGTPYRLPLCMALVTVTFVSITMTAKRTGESLRHCPLGPGEVALAARGYGPPEAIRHTVPPAPATACTLPVPLGTAEAEPVPLWGQAYRLPPAQATKARRLCRPQHRKNGQQPTKLTRWLAAGVLVGTTLPPTLLPGPTALAVYRARWHIEVAMRRWKSVLDVDLLPAGEERPWAEVWLHGKLLYVLMLDRRRRRPLGEQWRWLDRMRAATWWRPWKLLHDEVAPRRTGVLSGQPRRWAACWPVVGERPRRRQLQRLPDDISLVFCVPTINPHP